MPSFDIVIETDKVSLQHAFDNSVRELQNRFDFRGVQAEYTLNEFIVTLKAESDFQVEQMEDIFRTQSAKRNLNMMGVEKPETMSRSGKFYSTTLTFKQGIEQEDAKRIVKFIKESKLKVQASIQGDKVRVTGKKRDDLQETIAMLKNSDLNLPMEFENFRE
ncbi:YajQ family cyclic di-GMP-binding protein [Legionella sp. W05-934-2]|uniref:YajQ family cyclic di-GMP-binding protein n=1 Tax=Legionella sp. W05-934-2 TaxID=1198649 RepID=UPI003462BACA